MKSLINMKKVGGVFVAATVTSFGTMAADHSTAIGAAGTDGETNVGAAVVVVLGIAAVLTGIYAVLKLLGR